MENVNGKIPAELQSIEKNYESRTLMQLTKKLHRKICQEIFSHLEFHKKMQVTEFAKEEKKNRTEFYCSFFYCRFHQFVFQ